MLLNIGVEYYNRKEYIEALSRFTDAVSLDNQFVEGHYYSALSWYNLNWQDRKKLTLDSSMVEGDVTNFPVLVSLTSDSDLAADRIFDYRWWLGPLWEEGYFDEG